MPSSFFRQAQASLLLKFVLLLLLVVVPISALASLYSYEQLSTQVRQRVSAGEQAWAKAQSDALAVTLVQEAERVEALGDDDDVRSPLAQSYATARPSITETAAIWRKEGPQDPLHYERVTNPTSLLLGNYLTRFPNRNFALLARLDGELLVVTSRSWPEYDLRNFSWWTRVAGENSIIITEPLEIPGIGRQISLIIVKVSSRLQGADKDGVLIVGFDLGQLAQPLLSDELPDEHSSWLLADGRVLNNVHSNLAVLPTGWTSNFKTGSSAVLELPATSNQPAVVLAYAYLSSKFKPTFAQNDSDAVAAISKANFLIVRTVPQQLAYAELGGQLQTIMLAILLLAMAVITVLVIVCRRLLFRPLRKMEQVMDRVAAGNLGVRLASSSHDELGRLSNRFDRMLAELGALLREREAQQQQQQEVSNQLQVSASELHTSVTQQQAFASQQAAALQEIAATFGQLTGAASRIAHYGQELTAVAETLRQEQEQGQQALVQTRTVLERLRADSQSLSSIAHDLDRGSVFISSVVAEVNTIADETHLLALNATIEAAGAGAAGKRFGVIANQVQALAVRSSEAATTVQQRLGQTQNSIKQAATLTQQELNVISDGVSHSVRLEQLMHTVATTIERLTASTTVIAQETRQQREGSNIAASTIDSLVTAGQQLAQFSVSLNHEANQLRALATYLHGNSSTSRDLLATSST